jgi:hypothetical protein
MIKNYLVGNILLFLLLFGLFCSQREGFQVIKRGDTVVDPKALTIEGEFGQAINGLSFQQDAVITHNNYQYVGYYNANRQICLARRRLPKDDWEIIRFTDYDFKSNDAHNIISLGICPKDGTIHVAFDHHGHPLHYRVSMKNVATIPETVSWSSSLFGSTVSELEKGKSIKITYPRFWQTPEGGLQFCYRRGGSGNGDRMLVDYNYEKSGWVNTRQIDSREGLFEDEIGKSESRCSYPNGYNYGPKGKLHVSWVWRERSQGANHDLMYAYSKDFGHTWLNNKGELLKEPPRISSPHITVFSINRTQGLMNTHGQAVDSQGRIHVVMWHTSAKIVTSGETISSSRWGPPLDRRYFHYWRDKKGTWYQRVLPGPAGNRAKLFIDTNNNTYLIYNAPQNFSKMDQDIFFVGGDLTIAAASAKSLWTDWQKIHVEPGPFVNEMLGDFYRWEKEGILSVMVQESPKESHESTALRIIDFYFRNE